MRAVTRTEISPAIAGSWQDVDVSAYVSAGSTAGIMIEIVNESASEFNWGVRKNGSTDDIKDAIEDTGKTYAAIGVDDDDILEIYRGNANVKFYIVAYITNDEGVFFTNAVDKSLAATSAWTDIDISSHTGDDTSKLAFFLIGAGMGNYDYGLRKNGSTDDRYEEIADGDLRGSMMGVDDNEILEGYVSSISIDIYLVGYLKEGVVTLANAIDYSTTTCGSYVDVDFSSDIPADNTGALVHQSRYLERKFAIRKKGDSYDSYYDLNNHQYGWTEIDSSRLAEQKIEDVNCKLYLWGYTFPYTKPPPPPTFGQATIKSSNQVEANIKNINNN